MEYNLQKTLNHYAVHLKLIQYYKSTIHQQEIIKIKVFLFYYALNTLELTFGYSMRQRSSFFLSYMDCSFFYSSLMNSYSFLSDVSLLSFINVT